MLARDSKHRAARLGIAALFIVLSLSLMSLGEGTRIVRAQGDVLLDEQFQDNSNNWKLASTKSTKMDVGDGRISLELSREGAAGWALPDMTFPDDMDIEADTVTTATPDSGGWSSAIIIRANTRDLKAGFYQFEVDDGGTWAFVTRTANGDEYKVQKSGQVDDWDITSSNTLKVQARGTTFTFLVNGKKVGVFEDDQINNEPDTEKYIGLLVTTFEKTSSVTVEFSNLKVTKPGSPIKIKTPVSGNGSTADVITDRFEDTFPTNNPNGWAVGKTSGGQVKIQNNALQVQINKDAWLMWSYPAQNVPQDIDVTVTATNLKPDATGMWDYGIGVRGFTTSDNEDYFYLFRVNGDGTWEFSKLEGTNGTTVIVDPTTIKSFHAEDDNTLRVTAIGDHFEFFLNGKKLGEADDDTLEKQDSYKVFLAAGTYKGLNKLTVDFTDFIVEPK